MLGETVSAPSATQGSTRRGEERREGKKIEAKFLMGRGTWRRPPHSSALLLPPAASRAVLQPGDPYLTSRGFLPSQNLGDGRGWRHTARTPR